MRLGMRKLLVLLLSVMAHATSLTGNINGPSGTGVTGTLRMSLNSPGALSSFGSCGGPIAVVTTAQAVYTLTNGAMPGGATIYGNDCILPGGTYYNVTVIDNQQNVLMQTCWTITGSSMNVGTLQPCVLPIVVPPVNLPQDQLVHGLGFQTTLGLANYASDPSPAQANGDCYWNTTTPTVRCTSLGVYQALSSIVPIAHNIAQFSSGVVNVSTGLIANTQIYMIATVQNGGQPAIEYATTGPSNQTCTGSGSVGTVCIISSNPSSASYVVWFAVQP